MGALPLIMAGAGILHGGVNNHEKMVQYNRDKELAAQTQQYSPWTGLQAQPLHHPGSVSGDMLQGGVGLGMTGLNIQNSMAKPPVDPLAGASVIGQKGAGMNQMSGGYEGAPNTWGDSNTWELLNNRRPTFYNPTS